MGSIGQRAAKLPAFKFGGLKKMSAAWPRPHLNHSARFRVHLGSNHSQSLTDSYFAAPWPTDPKFSALKDLNPFPMYIKSSKGWCHFKGMFCLLKMTSVCFKNGQMVGLFCSSLYLLHTSIAILKLHQSYSSLGLELTIQYVHQELKIEIQTKVIPITSVGTWTYIHNLNL